MADAALRILINAVDNASQTIAGVGNRLRGFGQSAGLIGGMLTAGVTLPLVGIAKQAVQTAGDFEAQMNVLSVAARSSGTSLEDLSKAALLVGADTQLVGINSAEAADAMTNFYKAGLDTADVFGGELNQYLQEGTNLTGALRSAIDLAAASELDLNQASMLVATSMATFGLEATETGRIANSFVGAADASTASVADLYQAMQNIGPTAAAFGFSLEETNTALAILSTRGIAGAEAGTALKSMFTNMMRGTADSVAALDELNIELYDSAGNMHSMENIIGQLSKSMAGMTEEQRNSYVQTLAGTYGMKAMNTLLAEGVTGWDAMEQAIADAATAQEVGAARTQGLNAAWEQLKGALETVYIQVGLPLIQNFLTPLVQKVTEVISGILKLNPQVLESAVAFAAVLAAIGPVTLAIGAISTALGVLLSPIGLVVAAVAGLALAFTTNFAGIRDIVSGFVGSFTADMVAAGDASLSLTEGLYKLGVTLGMSATDAEKFSQRVGDAVGPVITNLVTWFQTNIPQALETLRGVWETVWGTLQTYVEVVIAVVGPLIESFVSGAVGFFTETWPQILTTVQTVFQGISETVSGVLGGVWEVIQQILGAILIFVATHSEDIKGFFSGAWETIQTIVSTALTIIQTVISAAMTFVSNTIVPVLTAIATFIQTHSTEIQTVLSAAWTAISTVIETVLGVIEGVIKAVLLVIQGDWSDAWETLKETGRTLWEGISQAIIAIAMAIGPLLEGFWEDIKAQAVAVWEDIKTKAGELWEGVKTAIAEKIGEALAAAVQWLDDTFVAIESFDLKAAAETFFGTTLPGIAAKVSEALESVGSWLSDTWEKISGYDLKDATETSFATVVAGIATKASEALKDIGKLLGNIGKRIGEYTFKSATMTAIQTVVVGIIEKAVKVLEAVGTFLADISKKISEFDLAEAGKALIAGFIGGIKAKAQDVLDAVGGVVQGGIDWAKSILGISSPSRVFEEIGINVMIGFIEGIDEKKVAAAKAVAEAISSIIQAAVRAADALREFRPVNGLGVITAQIRDFLIGVEAQFADLIARTDEKLAAKAQQFAESAGAVVALLVAGVDALKGLQTLERFDPSETIGRVAWAISMMVGNIDLWGRQFSGEVLTAARRFAEAAGPVADALSAGVAMLMDLPALKRFDPSEAIGRVAWAISMMVGNFDLWGRQFSTEVLDAARRFAEGAGAVVGVVADGIKAIGELAAWETSAPNIPDVLPKLTALRDWLRFIVLYIADATRYVSEDAQAAARAFAEAAGPVVGLVGNALKAISELAEWETVALVIPDVLPKLAALRDWLRFIVLYLADATRYVSDEAQTAARAFAESAGPVVGVVGNALKAIGELANWESVALVVPEVLPKLAALRDWLSMIVLYIADATRYAGTEAQAAARAFAEATGPVLSAITSGIKLLGDIAEIEPPDTATLKGALGKVTELLTELIATFTDLNADQGTLLGALQTFIANVDTTLTALSNALATLKEIGELQAPQIGLQWVYQLVNAMVRAIPSLEPVFTQIAGIFTAFQPDGRAAGLGFMRTLANGIRDGLDYVESALQAVADLFPASPAKAGPLRQVPDWQAWMLGGLDSAVGLVSAGLSSVNGFPGAALPGNALAPAPAPAEAASITINFHNPVVREENDLRRIVDAVSEILAQRTQTQTRLGLTW